MKLDVYRSCSRAEKREMLNVYWHRNVQASDRIGSAALQYGPWAIVCLVVLVLELIFVIALSFGSNQLVAFAATAAEVLVVLSLWWAVVRFAELKGQLATT